MTACEGARGRCARYVAPPRRHLRKRGESGRRIDNVVDRCEDDTGSAFGEFGRVTPDGSRGTGQAAIGARRAIVHVVNAPAVIGFHD